MDVQKLALCAIVSISSAISSYASTAENKVIYGEDNRANLHETRNPMFLKLADSTVALIRNERLTAEANGVTKITARTFKEGYRLCSTERFNSEPIGAFCSGSLIGKNLVLTAGHCVRDEEGCADTSFVFGYGIDRRDRNPSEVKTSNVYNCKKIIHTQMSTEDSFDGVDFAIIELDRNVTDHEALKMATRTVTQRLEVGTRLLLIGHPAGLPTKVEDGGKVRHTRNTGFFVANTDSYGGNSGSAVFNYLTGEIEGILVRGEKDFIEMTTTSSTGTVNSCRLSKVCAEGECRGEDVTEISRVAKYMPMPTTSTTTPVRTPNTPIIR